MKLYTGDINILADLPPDWQERIGKAFGVILVYGDREIAEEYETHLNEVEIEKGKRVRTIKEVIDVYKSKRPDYNIGGITLAELEAWERERRVLEVIKDLAKKHLVSSEGCILDPRCMDCSYCRLKNVLDNPQRIKIQDQEEEE